MATKSRIGYMGAMAAVAAMLLVGCDSTSFEKLPAIDSIEDAGLSDPAEEEAQAQPEAPSEPEVPSVPVAPVEPVEPVAPSDPVPSSGGYQAIYDQYAKRLIAECPALAMMECAELSNEGVSEMAAFMLKAKGTDGQYETYETWSQKLMDVYMSSVQ